MRNPGGHAKINGIIGPDKIEATFFYNFNVKFDLVETTMQV